jgi:hypothetical protein
MAHLICGYLRASAFYFDLARQIRKHSEMALFLIQF